MTHWAYSEELDDEKITIEEAEAHHLLHVMRCKVGDPLTLFNGMGTVAQAVISSTTRHSVICAVVSKVQHENSACPVVTVIASPPKAERLKWMVEKLTEIGVDRLTLLNTRRTIVVPGETRHEKLRATVVAACKQSQRPFLMDVAPLQTFASVLGEMNGSVGTHVTYLAHPGTMAAGASLFSKHVGMESVSVLIGPEGGFTDDEVQQAFAAGALPISWPSNTLRIETAALVFATMLRVSMSF